MVKVNILKEKVKSINSADYSIPLEVSLEDESISIDKLKNIINDAEGKLRKSGLSFFVDFAVNNSNSSIVDLSFKEEHIDKLNDIIKDFKKALEISVKESIEREIKYRESQKQQEKKVKETLEKIRQIKFD